MTVDEKGNIHLPSLAAVNFCPHSRLEDMMQTTFTLIVNNAVVRLLIFKNLLAQHVHRLSPVGAGPFPTGNGLASRHQFCSRANKFKMREYYEDVDGRNFYSSTVVWFNVCCSGYYIKFII